MSYKICILLPTYNHFRELPRIVKHLHGMNFNILIVDDGSHQKTQAVINQIKFDIPSIHTLRLPINTGKGAAITAGLHELKNKGYSHVFQIDADGQHSLECIADFVKISKENPLAVVTGNPVYDNSVPKARQIGRWCTHVWVWVETLSFRITDSMCGYRIYPINETLNILDKTKIGLGMQFDTEIIVHLFWKGTPVLMSPVPVSYPEGNTSNFNLWRDNWRITKMHTMLVMLMLLRLPDILINRPNYKNIMHKESTVSWFKLNERGTLLGLHCLAQICRLLGRRVCNLIGYPIVLFYYLTNHNQRNASHTFLNRIYKYGGLPKEPGFKESFHHFMNFFDMAMDKFSAWAGQNTITQLADEEIDKLNMIMNTKRGGMLLISHLGNIDFCRALSLPDKQKRLHILMHSKNSKRFNQILKFFNPNSTLNIVEVTEIGPDTIIFLKERIEEGEWIVIAADRSPIKGNEHTSLVPFLGQPASFAHGPYILASILECPVYTVFALKEENQYRVYAELLAQKITLDRKRRAKDLENYIKHYASILQKYCIQYPYQWFNFFAFWHIPITKNTFKKDSIHETN